MKKFIVTTTINPPTEALELFARMNDYTMIVAGDQRTPHVLYEKRTDLIYLSPEYQEKKWKTLSDLIGWKSIQRRNFAFLEAYERGADIIATIDDDNIPLQGWGVDDQLINSNVSRDVLKTGREFFDPIYATGDYQYLWHRGFPVQEIHMRNLNVVGKKTEQVRVNAQFWNGDPDIDAICRISFNPEVLFSDFQPFTSEQLTPFNSQNTFLTRDVIPYYMMMIGVGRLDDIFGGYVLQQIANEVGLDLGITFSKPTVYQKRNPHNLVVDLEKEVIGYNKAIEFSSKRYTEILPKETLVAFEEYNKLFK